MGRSCGLWVLGLVLLLPLGCSQGGRPIPPGTPVVRVRVLENQNQVMVAASEPPLVRVSSEDRPRRLGFPSEAVPVTLAPNGWKIGDFQIGRGELTIEPASVGSVQINGASYRGAYRFVPVAADRFDVVNHVDVESYLKSVVSKELLWNWDEETYKAQAIVARTYALYQWKTTSNKNRHYDLNPDQRSQMYGGIAAESSVSRRAVDATQGIVAAYGPKGKERIFKAYYSSCCGGITLSATDAFGDQYIEPLSDQNVMGLCNASPRFNWGPIVLKKKELTRRFREFGKRRDRIEKDMGEVARIDIQAINRWGRPVRFLVTDNRGVRYSWGGEEIRWAVNTDAKPGTSLYSSFFKVINSSDEIHFVEGHGWGHGVGMCQWCAQRRAESGMRHEDIVLSAFQHSTLIRAY